MPAAWSRRRSPIRDCATARASFHPPTASTSGACCRRSSTTRPPASTVERRTGRAGLVHRPQRQPGQCHGVHLGARDGLADRRDRAGAQRQPHRARLPRERASGSRAPSVATLASAMDVGNPSNMERLRNLYPDCDALRRALTAAQRRATMQIRARIRADYAALRHGSGARIRPRRPRSTCSLPRGAHAGSHWVLVATAHPAKFSEIVEPLIGVQVPVPPALAALLALPRQRDRNRR